MNLPTEKELEKYFDRLWPLCRSITGNGLRQSVAILKELCPVESFEVASGTRIFDWTVPNEWNIEDAWVENEAGQRIIDFKNSNLHVVGYSVPVDAWLTLDELEKHLHSLPAQPDAIPYLTTYYKERWGFCLTHRERQKLKPGKYRAVIRSSLKPGSLTLSHCVLPSTNGNTEEFLLSTYLCHPSMANNELSGPLVTAFLYTALSGLKQRRYNYRFVFVPETIGAIAYLNQFGDYLRAHCAAGLVVTCCGDDRTITYKRSRRGNTLIDRVTERVLKSRGKPHQILNFFPAGSDERQYCSPGFNLPVGSLMRSMYGTYPEYHTSLDNKSLISFAAMRETIELYLEVIRSLEENRIYKTTVMCGEPMLSPRGLYPSLGSQKAIDETVQRMMWLINLSDGQHDLESIAEQAGCTAAELASIAKTLTEKGLLV